MIRGINAGPHLTISDGYAPTPSFSPGAQSAGMVRYNTNMQCMEVYDGIGWQTIYTAHPTVDLAPASREAVEWAMRKQHEERNLKEMMERHPGLKDLYDKFEMMKILCQEESEQK
jgi:hypothetical protein